MSKLRKLQGERITLAFTNWVPSYGLLLIDPETDHGVIIVELYPYLRTATKRVHFELTSAGGHWYTHFRDQFESIWRDATKT